MRTQFRLLAAASAASFLSVSALAANHDVACEVTTVPYQTSTLLFRNVQLSDVTGLKATSYVTWGSNAFQSYAIDTIYANGATPAPEQNNYDYNGFYWFELSADESTLTFQVQTKANQGYNGCLFGILFVELTQNGSDVWGQVTGMKYPYGQNYGVDGRTAGNSNTCKYFYDSNMNDSHAVFNFSLQDLVLVVRDNQSGSARTVTVLDKDGAVLTQFSLAAGETDATSYMPSAASMEVPGFVFKGWDADISEVLTDLTVSPVYAPLYLVRFLADFGDGVLELIDAQFVEEGQSAIAPDIVDYGIEENDFGEPFLGWNADFSNVQSNLNVEAMWGMLPPHVAAAIESGLVPEGALIWGETVSGTWDASSANWFTAGRIGTSWRPGAVAVFACDSEVTLSGAQTAGGILVLDGCDELEFLGDELDLASPATVTFATDAIARFLNTLGGANGLTLAALTGAAPAPTDFGVEIHGNYAATGKLSLRAGSFLTVAGGTLGGGSFSQEIEMLDGILLFGSDGSNVSQTLASKITKLANGTGYVQTLPDSAVTLSQNTSNDGYELRIGGVTTANAYRAVPYGGEGYPACENPTNPSDVVPPHLTRVLSGGELVLGNISKPWGLAGRTAPLFVDSNAVLRLTGQGGIGLYKGVHLVGGREVCETASENLLYRQYLSDGAEIAGKPYWAGQTDYYSSSANATYPGSFISVTGSSPCSVTAEAVWLGSTKTATAAKPVLLTWKVADATGDDDTDLLVSAGILQATMTSIDAPTSFGQVKEGAGTLEFTSPTNAVSSGSLTMKAGTVRFGEGCGGTFGVLALAGNSALDCAGGTMAFADSSAVAWDETAMLSITGTPKPRSIRFGTDSNGLTAAQLARIAFNGKLGKAKLDANGYLRGPDPATVFFVQ